MSIERQGAQKKEYPWLCRELILLSAVMRHLPFLLPGLVASAEADASVEGDRVVGECGMVNLSGVLLGIDGQQMERVEKTRE